VPPEALRSIDLLTAGPGGSAELALSRSVTVALPELPFGFQLRVAREVSVQPGVMDVQRRRIDLRVRGLSLVKGLLSVRLRGATLAPDGEGYRLRVHAGLWGFIPVWKTFRGAGARVTATDDGPLLVRPTPGIVGTLQAP
jgi:hypothetical protein